MIVDKYKTDLPDSLKDTLAKDTFPMMTILLWRK
mgnify:CR=1 FL=1